MAITVSAYPALTNSAYRAIEYTVSSNAATITRMKGYVYKNDVLINPSNPIVEDTILGSSSIFKFNIQEIISKNLTYNIHASASKEDIAVTNSWCSFRMDFTEVLLTSGQLVDGTTHTSTAGENKYAINGVLKQNVEQDFDNYFLSNFASFWLTAKPLSIAGSDWASYYKKRMYSNLSFVYDFNESVPHHFSKVQLTDSEYIRILNYVTYYADMELMVVTYNALNVNQQICVIDTQNTEIMFDVGVGPANLNAATLKLGSQPVIASDTAWYYVVIRQRTSPLTMLSTRRDYLLQDYTNRDNVRFHFINRFGAIDSITFTGNIIRGIDIKKETYNRPLGTTFTKSERGLTTLGIRSNEVFTAYSEILTKWEMWWLQDLLEDIQTWVEVNIYETGAWTRYNLPVNIEDGEYELVNEAENLYQMKIKYKYSFDSIRQTN